MPLTTQYGSYTYPSSLIEKRPIKIDSRLRAKEIPGRSLAYSQGGLIGTRRVIVTGTLKDTTLWDAFLAAHAPGQAKALYMGSSATRYLMAEVESISDIDADQYPAAIPWEVGFICYDPLWYGIVVNPTITSTGGSFTVSGSAPAEPILTITLGGTIPGGYVTITATNSGKSMVITPAASGAIVIDNAARTITRAGVDITAELSTLSEFLSFTGSDTLTIAAAGGLTVSSPSLSYTERWY